MADTDLPNGYGAIDRPSGPSRPPRPIASPFGIFPDPWQTPNPNQTPGFNVQPDQPPTNPMSSLLASFMPSGDNWKQSLAENLGAPVDAASYALMKLGLPIPRAPTDTPYAYPGPTGSRGTWAPAASVPFGSQSIRGMLDNPPSLDAVLRALRRPGLF
jgi:hypothetical protein